MVRPARRCSFLARPIVVSGLSRDNSAANGGPASRSGIMRQRVVDRRPKEEG